MIFSIPVTESSAVGEARRVGTRLAAELKFSETDIAKVGIIITEAANNLIKHTSQGGEVVLQSLQHEDKQALDIVAFDKGVGISNLSQCLVDGYSTAGTMGTGMGAIKRLATEFDVYSLPNLGTALWARVITHLNPQPTDPVTPGSDLSFDVSGICTPIKGESISGDGWFTHYDTVNSLLWCLVADGLGHGDGAYFASNLAINTFKSCLENTSLSISEIITRIHKALVKTRGAALAIARIDIKHAQLNYAGIGNISGVIISDKKRQSLMSLNGIIGNNIRKIQEVSYVFLPNSVLVMHSDGLRTHWDLDQYAGLLRKSSPLVAGVLYRDYKRGSDDVTVLVVKKSSVEEKN